MSSRSTGKPGSAINTGKQIDFFEWMPEACPVEKREGLGNFSQYMNPPEDGEA